MGQVPASEAKLPAIDELIADLETGAISTIIYSKFMAFGVILALRMYIRTLDKDA